MTIAGHTFVHGLCECGRRWADIRGATDADIDRSGIAHTGVLTARELAQIEEVRVAEDTAIARAMGWAA